MMNYVLIGLLILIVLIILYTFFKGVKMVPDKWEWLITCFGKRKYKFTAGLHWVFPLFGIYEVKHEVFMGTQSMPLTLGQGGAFGGGVVDFKDESAPVEARFYFRIKDSEKAAYDVADILKFIEENADGTLRAFLANFDIEEANELKNHFNVEIIAHSVTDKEVYKDVARKAAIPSIEDSDLYKTLLARGVVTEGFIIIDIDLPARVIEQRKRQLEADMDRQVSEIEIKKTANVAKSSIIKARGDKTVKIALAEGDAISMDRITLAMAKRIEELVKQGMNAADAADYVVSLAKTDALSKSEHVTWIEGSKNAAVGAEFGAGLATQKK